MQERKRKKRKKWYILTFEDEPTLYRTYYKMKEGGRTYLSQGP